MLKHGAELAGWLLLAIGMVAYEENAVREIAVTDWGISADANHAPPGALVPHGT